MNNKLNEITLLLRDLAETPGLDAQVLLAHIIGQSRTWVLAHPEMELTPGQQAKLTESLSRMRSGVSLPYIIGWWEFYGLEMIVTQDVLIPRPETELLVDKALDWLRANPERRRVIDTGTGSGCIAVALADHIPDLQVIASDISDAAIRVARKNARKFNVSDRIVSVCCHLFPAKKVGVWSRFSAQTNKPSSGADLIVANLPYIPTSTLRGLKVYGREPDLALDGGEDGLDVIRQFFERAPAYLEPGGMILMEIEASQGLSALSLAYDHFSEAIIHLHQDFSGRDRLLEINLQP
jgi:release factor glutamine methyltransferase